MAIIKNLTPHTVTVFQEDGTTRIFPSLGNARASQTTVPDGTLDGIDLVKMEFGETTDLPEPEEGVYLIVSIITANAAQAQGRRTDDLLVTANPVRDANMRIIGCKSFARV